MKRRFFYVLGVITMYITVFLFSASLFIEGQSNNIKLLWGFMSLAITTIMLSIDVKEDSEKRPFIESEVLYK